MSTCGRTVTAVHSVPRAVTVPRCDGAPVPTGTGAPNVKERGTGGSFYRQRIDMIRPMIITPKPTAKFHTPRDTMNGMRSPAT